MRGTIGRAIAVVGAVAAASCGSGSSGGGPVGSGGGPATVDLSFALSRPATSADFTALDLDVTRVVLFFDTPAPPEPNGFACAAAGGTAVDVPASVHVDFTATGTTPVVTVRAPAGNLADVWLLARGRIVMHGRTHAAHGQVSCFAPDGKLEMVLAFVPRSPIPIAAPAAAVVGVIDVRNQIGEQGDCDTSCDEDDQHLQNPDPTQGRILVVARHELDAGGSQ